GFEPGPLWAAGPWVRHGSMTHTSELVFGLRPLPALGHGKGSPGHVFLSGAVQYQASAAIFRLITHRRGSERIALRTFSDRFRRDLISLRRPGGCRRTVVWQIPGIGIVDRVPALEKLRELNQVSF